MEPPLPLVELPSDLRRDLGELEMNVHVYHEDPERRFVFINMRSHRIGDPVGADGVVLESITPEGAVLAYDGRRILLPLPR